jgi:hypothetical protein
MTYVFDAVSVEEHTTGHLWSLGALALVDQRSTPSG